MKKNKIKDAMNYIEDDLIEEAANISVKKKKILPKILLLAACFVLVVVGVYSISNRGISGKVEEVLAATYPKGYDFDDFDTKMEINEKNPVNEDFTDSINNFSFKTASKILTDQDKNTLYSPISLYYALAIATQGANGETEKELLKLLEIDDKETLSKQAGNLYRILYTDNKISKLKIANSVWLDKSMNYNQKYIDAIKKDYYASLFSADFSDKSATTKEIKKWISENTNKTLDFDSDIDDNQLMIILNTIYFYDEWTQQFDKNDTKQDTFNLSDGKKVKCDFMNRTEGNGSFYIGDGYISSSLELKNGSSMVFVLPDENSNLKDLLSKPENLKKMFTQQDNKIGEVVWKIPKFSYGDSIELKEILKSLNVEKAFGNGADFSGISDEDLFISDVKQDSHIAIDENGVEASAYTEIAMCKLALVNERVEMNLDRPFIYGIVSPQGNLLFVGVCNNPNQQ